MKSHAPLIVLSIALLLLLAAGWPPLSSFLLTRDQQAAGAYRHGQHALAAETFTDPTWQATAHFRDGEFKQAGAIYAGYDTAEGAYNHGNALVMQGRYEDAIPRYERALALKPAWPDAEINLQVARDGAERVKLEGGNMTGGQMGADDFTFTKGKPPDPEAGEETVEAGAELNDAALRAMWLRKVQTQPADFLKSKFAYQVAARESTQGEAKK